MRPTIQKGKRKRGEQTHITDKNRANPRGGGEQKKTGTKETNKRKSDRQTETNESFTREKVRFREKREKRKREIV